MSEDTQTMEVRMALAEKSISDHDEIIVEFNKTLEKINRMQTRLVIGLVILSFGGGAAGAQVLGLFVGS